MFWMQRCHASYLPAQIALADCRELMHSCHAMPSLCTQGFQLHLALQLYKAAGSRAATVRLLLCYDGTAPATVQPVPWIQVEFVGGLQCSATTSRYTETFNRSVNLVCRAAADHTQLSSQHQVAPQLGMFSYARHSINHTFVTTETGAGYPDFFQLGPISTTASLQPFLVDGQLKMRAVIKQLDGMC